MAGTACFLISAEQEDAVVGTRAQDDAGQQAGGEDGDADDAVLAEQATIGRAVTSATATTSSGMEAVNSER